MSTPTVVAEDWTFDASRVACGGPSWRATSGELYELGCPGEPDALGDMGWRIVIMIGALDALGVPPGEEPVGYLLLHAARRFRTPTVP